MFVIVEKDESNIGKMKPTDGNPSPSKSKGKSVFNENILLFVSGGDEDGK